MQSENRNQSQTHENDRTAAQTGPLRPAVRARRLRRGLRRQHQGQEVPRDHPPGAHHPAEPRPPRRLRLRGQHRRRRGHPDADAARVSAKGLRRERASSCPPEGQYGVGMVFLPPDAARARASASRFSARSSPRKASASSAGATVPTEQFHPGRNRPGVRAVHAAGLHRAQPEARPTTWRSSASSTSSASAPTNAIRRSGCPGRRILVHLQPVVQDAGLQRHAQHRAGGRSISPTCRTRRWKPRWRWSIRVSAPTPSRAGTAAIPTATSPTTAKSTRCAATSTGCTRARRCSSPNLFGDDIKKILPVINTDGSDSAMFDNCLELLVLAGRSLPHAMMMMIPEPWTEPREHERREEGVLRISQLPDGAVGRPGFDRLHRRQEDRRGARPQRPAALALLRDQGRSGHHGLAKSACWTSRRSASCTRAGCSRAACSWSTPRRAASSPTRRSSTRSPPSSPTAQWLEQNLVELADVPDAAASARARPRDRAAAAAGVRLHVRGPAHPHGADGARRRRSGRLDGHGHAAGRAVGQAAAALQLFQAALRAGHQSADRLHPRGNHHVDGDDHRLRAQPAQARAGKLPSDRAEVARS